MKTFSEGKLKQLIASILNPKKMADGSSLNRRVIIITGVDHFFVTPVGSFKGGVKYRYFVLNSGVIWKSCLRSWYIEQCHLIQAGKCEM